MNQDFGGLGGIMGKTRPVHDFDDFEVTIQRIFGERMKQDDALCHEIWSALANVDWHRPESNDSASYSLRAVGDLVAAIRGSGDYLDWYCNSDYPSITDEIRRSLKKAGWIPDAAMSICDEDGCLEDATCGWNDGLKPRSTCGKHQGQHHPRPWP